MKNIKIALIILGIIGIVAGVKVYAITIQKLHVTSWMLTADVFSEGAVKKFKDGTNVCYLYTNSTGVAISCVKSY